MHSNDQNNFRFMVFNATLIQHFRYIVVIRFIGRGNRRQPPSQVRQILSILFRVHHAMNSQIKWRKAHVALNQTTI